MSLSLPPTNSALRELFDLPTLASLSHPANRAKLPTLQEAIKAARAFLLREPAAASVHCLVLNPTTCCLHLMRINREETETLWNFGFL